MGATRGRNTLINAPPQVFGDAAAVMNGTIRNYAELKDELGPFRSENDTEAVAALANAWKGNLRMIAEGLEGRYSCIVMYHGRIGCIRRGPPRSQSESPPTGCTWRPTRRPSRTAPARAPTTWSGTRSRTWTGTAAGPVRLGRAFPWSAAMRTWAPPEPIPEGASTVTELEQAAVLPNPAVEWHPAGREIVVTGSGSSYHIAMLFQRVLRQKGYSAEAVPACEYGEGGATEIVILSQSGETGDALRAAEASNCRITCVTNAPHSSLAALADRTIPLECGPETGVGRHKVVPRAGPGPSLQWPGERAGGIDVTVPRGLAECLAGSRDAYILGSGTDYIAALEGALKMKELLYMHAEAILTGEFKHGPRWRFWRTARP